MVKEIPGTPDNSTADLSATNSHKRRHTSSPTSRSDTSRQYYNRSDSMHGSSSIVARGSKISRLSLDGQTSQISSLITKIHSTTRITNGLKDSTETSSHLSSFYQEQVRELNELQDTLFKKKAKLDQLRDIVNTAQEEFNETKSKWEKIRDDKVSKEQQLKLKKIEINKLKESNLARKKFLEDGHRLHLQQMEVENQTKINKLVNEYHQKIDNLKKIKIKKFENERNDLLTQIDNLKDKLENNDQILDSMIKEVRDKYDKEKEDWLKDYQENWKDTLQTNDNYLNEINKLKIEIKEILQPKSKQLLLRIDQLKQKREDLQKILDERRQEKLKLQNKIKENNDKIEENRRKQNDLKQSIERTENDLKEINDIMVKEETLRRSLHNELQELRGNIRVFCRIRPPLPKIESNDTSHIIVNKFDDSTGTQTVEISKKTTQQNGSSSANNNSVPQTFKFDKIFDIHEKNSEVFKEVGQLVQSSLDGYNVSIFAYGQTGSGKTYTMLNPGDGIIPATISHIFGWIEKLKERGWKYKIECQFVEIYNENIIDLLRGNNGATDDNNTQNLTNKCEIRHDHENESTTIKNASTCILDSKATVEQILKKASKLRSTATTQSNEHSSRSHSIFIIHLKGKNSITQEESYGILNLIDLAGSERIHSSQVSGDRLRETQNINRSLSCLGDVIHALNAPDGKRHIPFRNSKLTYLLQYSLTGNSKTLMFVNISSSTSHINETLNSLRFASKVNSTKVGK